jgi:hypothetical protein
MNAFQAEVGGDQGLVPRRNAKHRAVVTDSGGNARPSSHLAAKMRD